MLTVSSAAPGVRDKRAPSLVRFHPRGHLLLSGRAYYVVLKIDTETILKQIEPISTALEEIRHNLVSHTDADPRHYHHAPNGTTIDQVLTQTLQKHLKFLSADLSSRQKALIDFLKSLGEFDYDAENSEPAELKNRKERKPKGSKVRAQRGLFDAGGKILSYIFGTATESEIQDTKEIMQRLADLTEEQREQVNVHTQLLNSTAMHLDALESHVARVTTCLSAVRENIEQLRWHLKDNTLYEYTLAHSMVMSSALAYASTAMADLTAQVFTIKAGINKFKGGFINSDIVPPETILKLAETITNLNLRPLFPATEEYLPSYYSYTRVWPLPHDGLSFIIEIPLVGDPVVKLRLFEIVALPHPVSDEHVLAYSGLPKYLAISDDRELYQERSSQDSCRTFEDTTICPIDEPVYRGGRHSCAVALFKGGDLQVCQKHFAPTSKMVQLHKTILGWVYSSSIHAELTITCADSVETVDLKPGSGLLASGDNCKITSNQFILPSSAEAKGSKLVKNISLVHPFDLHLNIDETSALALLNSTPILSEIMTLASDRLPVRSLRSEIGNLQYIKKMRTLNTISSHTGLSLSVVALLMTTALCIGAAVVYRYANSENDEVADAAPRQVGNRRWRPFRNPFKNRQPTVRVPMPLEQAAQVFLEEVVEVATPRSPHLTPRSPTIRRPSEAWALGRTPTGTPSTPTGTPPIGDQGECILPIARPRC